jgi:hypothetical protein
MDAPDDQDASIEFNLTGDFRDQLAVACVNLARFQRTAKGAGQSAARSGHHIIQRSCAWREFFRWHLVMLGHFRMHSKSHRILFGG